MGAHNHGRERKAWSGWGSKRMRVRQNGDGNRRTRQGGRRCRPKPVIAALASAATGERLEYIAAMVQELKAMAAQGGHETLTGLLDLAYQEALLRRRVGQ